MNDINDKIFMLNISPIGISLIRVNEISKNLNVFDTFNINIDLNKIPNASFSFFYKYLMDRVSEKILQKVVEGEIYNGDFIKLKPIIDKNSSYLEISVFRQLSKIQNIEDYIKNFSRHIPYTIEEKRNEIKNLHDKLNEAIEAKNILLCKEILQKIKYLRNEFII
ncbi:hypothetical protein SAMN02745883_00517 [Caminicella sporogenes DSM 14501]|uniref:Uncharacterized protein n=1 Tax=Caminicella sporogenes DSM 14501 TaxID=1121266 RepID=A0A1M6MFE3_9FIRM|nr:hypothetical protein [Caminicella sporogenes]RKD27574.1 hypothetical protein BET04_00450 [Caminicella sporogenes]SHJ82083.1 hypothetical protein SAMN02745883_00517 [Caminicella sporogenes DSM 14501]